MYLPRTGNPAEGAGCFFTNKISNNITNSIFMVIKCVKLVKNVIISDSECLSTCFSEKSEGIGAFWLKLYT